MFPTPVRINPDRFIQVLWIVPYGNRAKYVFQGVYDPKLDCYRFDDPDVIGEVEKNLTGWTGIKVPRLVFASWEWGHTALEMFDTKPEPFTGAHTPGLRRISMHRYTHTKHIFTATRSTYVGSFEVEYDPTANISEEAENTFWDNVFSVYANFAEKHSKVLLARTPDFTKVGYIQMVSLQDPGVSFQYLPSTYQPNTYYTSYPSFMCNRRIQEDMSQAHILNNLLRQMFWVQIDHKTYVYEDRETRLTAIYGPPPAIYDGGIWF